MTEVIVIPPTTPSVVVVPPIPSPTSTSSVNVSGTTVGPQGPKGDTGAQGVSGGNYVHTQNVSSNTWVISHNLGYNPSVTALDSAGTQVEGDVVWTSLNQLTVTFSAAFGGVAYLS